MNIKQSDSLFISNIDHSFSLLMNNNWYVYFISSLTGDTFDRPAVISFDIIEISILPSQIRLK